MLLKTKTLLILFCSSFVASHYARDSSSSMRNTIQVTAEGMYEAEPDTALLEFNLSIQEKNYKEAYEKALQATQNIEALLKKYELDPKQAEFSLFQVQPVYDYENPKRPLIGYSVHSTVSIKFTDFKKLSLILPDLADNKITDNQSLRYILEKNDEAKKKAIEDGYKRARLLAESLARSANKTIDEMIYASIDTFENRPQMKTFMARSKGAAMQSPSETFGMQKITITAQINAIFEMVSRNQD